MTSVGTSLNTPSQIEVRPSGAALGAEVVGVDAAHALTPDGVAIIRKALLDHSVITLRGQRLDGEGQVQFTRYFGEPEIHVRPTAGSTVPGIFVVSNVKEDGEPIGALGHDAIDYHSDLAFMPKPGTLSALYALEIPPTGGKTSWCSGYACYESLDEKTKARLDGLRATHRHPHEPNNPVEVIDHPVVVRHPETGRKALYVTPSFTRSILGLPDDDGEALLQQLFHHVAQPHLSWTHDWQVGDLVMWDNRCTMHRREPFPEESRRIMHRTQAFNEWIPAA
jgi:taurine dioxygenase|tara:strand:- start:939 stop:1778 length:840 start_codon:yes stop_codon:yes gene_type:complete